MSEATSNLWTVEPRGKGGVECLAGSKVDVDDFPFAVYAPAPPFAFGELICLVAKGADAQRNANILATSARLLADLKAIIPLVRECCPTMSERLYDRLLRAEKLIANAEAP